MWAILKTLLIQGFLAKTALKSFAWLAWLLPLGFLLKWVGLPIALVLGTLSAPVLIMLAVIGLPIIVVVVFAGMMIAIVGFVLSLGFAVLKFLLPIIIVYYVAKWLWRAMRPATPAPVVSDAPPSGL